MVADGNHERDWPDSGDRFEGQTDSGGECGVAHERRFLMPTEEMDDTWCASHPLHCNPGLLSPHGSGI
jgi:acid phosphatase type 7